MYSLKTIKLRTMIIKKQTTDAHPREFRNTYHNQQISIFWQGEKLLKISKLQLC